MSTTIIAGIARSGLSLTMQMLHAGGFPCLGGPPAFEDFPVGCTPWEECDGKAVKLVDSHLHFPPAGSYRVIRLHRDLIQQARSTNKWVGAVSGIQALPVSRLIGSIRRDYVTIDEWAAKHITLHLPFEDLVGKPREAAKTIAHFVQTTLNVDAMAACVIPRGPECHAELLEVALCERYA